MNTRFMRELNTVLYGAGLAMKYADAVDSQSADVLNQIVLSAFASLELDFDSMYASIHGAPAAAPEPYGAPVGGNPPAYLSQNAPETADTSFEFFNPNSNQNANLKLMYQKSEKTYDSRMDDDEDLERIPLQAFQHRF